MALALKTCESLHMKAMIQRRPSENVPPESVTAWKTVTSYAVTCAAEVSILEGAQLSRIRQMIQERYSLNRMRRLSPAQGSTQGGASSLRYSVPGGVVALEDNVARDGEETVHLGRNAQPHLAHVQCMAS